MADFVQHIINGIAAGTIYALVALGYTMVYGIIELINFAHGDVFTFGAYIGAAIIGLFAFPLRWNTDSSWTSAFCRARRRAPFRRSSNPVSGW